MADFKISADAQAKVNGFELADRAFKTAWEKFEQEHFSDLQFLDKLREERNAKLDSARRALRSEAEEVDITQVKYLRTGMFSVAKKWHKFYIPEKLVARLEAKDLLDTAFKEKIVAQKIEVEKFETVQAFLERHRIKKDCEDCEDGQELTPAVSGPKPIPAFGTEAKDK
jgi:hypothetical protein